MGTYIKSIFQFFPFFFLLGLPNITFSQFSKYVCYQTSEPLQIDGKAQESAWKNAPWTADFIDIQGDEKLKPPHQTRIKMLWDKDYFYVFAQMEEPHIWATLKERDDIIFHNDDFEIFIDPDGDGHHYYELEINALNTLWDLLMFYPYHLKVTPNYLFNWNILNIQTAVHVEGSLNDPSDIDEYWSVEWAIPWTALDEMTARKKLPASGEQWRMNFSRVDWKMEVIKGKYAKRTNPETGKNLPENNWVWSPMTRIDLHRPEEWGYVQFSEKVVGTGTEIFVEDPDESLKSVLWNLYYQQQDFYKKNGSYTSNLEDFDIPKLEGCTFEPTIFITPNLFEIIAKSCTGTGTWSIRQDAKIQYQL